MHHSFISDTVRSLKKNKASMFGLTIIVLFVLMAIFAKQIAPRDPLVQN